MLPEAGGWLKVLECFRTEHLPEMERNANRHLVLLIDFDKQEDRLNLVRAEIPDRLKERVFILGTWSEPEDLRQDLGSYEIIGLALAKDCHDDTDKTWAHDLLRHIAEELERLKRRVRPILFS